MTDREICEQIIKDDNCYGIACSKCPLDKGSIWSCNPVVDAKQWLAEHPEPCEYCNNSSNKRIISTNRLCAYVYKDELFVLDEAYEIDTGTKIHYCPMCGKKLEEK